MTALDMLGLCGPASIGIALVILGLLSKRLGSATRAPNYYIGFYVAAGLVFLSVAVQAANLLFDLASGDELIESWVWVFLYNGLPALGVTVGVIFAWRYWSWLLAERS
ncbi:MAG TPA: hypothetical protein VK003_21590 [Oceanobacillus sp.]|nr:hypothetical protein [Oceanobacillus sp.]